MASFFLPGPVDVSPEVLAAQARPLLPPSSPEFQSLCQRIQDKLKRLFFGSQDVFIFPGGQETMREAAVRNLVNERMLVCCAGSSSSRWVEIGRANDRQVDVLEVSMGEAVDPQRLADFLAGQAYEAVAITHTEISTGVTHPVTALSEAVHRANPETLLMLDVSASLGGVELPLEDWGADFTLSCGERCLALPPGLGLGAATPRALERASRIKNRGCAFDFVQYQRKAAREGTPPINPIPLLFSLDVQLDRIHLEGMPNRAARHAALAGRVREWAASRDLPVLAEPHCRADTLTVVQNRRGISIDDLNQFLLLRGMRLANGMGPLKDKYFCISNMGEIQPADLEALLNAVDMFIGN